MIFVVQYILCLLLKVCVEDVQSTERNTGNFSKFIFNVKEIKFSIWFSAINAFNAILA